MKMNNWNWCLNLSIARFLQYSNYKETGSKYALLVISAKFYKCLSKHFLAVAMTFPCSAKTIWTDINNQHAILIL